MDQDESLWHWSTELCSLAPKLPNGVGGELVSKNSVGHDVWLPTAAWQQPEDLSVRRIVAEHQNRRPVEDRRLIPDSSGGCPRSQARSVSSLSPSLSFHNAGISCDQIRRLALDNRSSLSKRWWS
jgi:hypothetical protein